MTTRTISIKDDLDTLFTYLNGLKLPITVNIKKGKDRSVEQNALAFKWYFEAGEQGDMSANDYRAQCKLEFGVPIMREEDDYRELYDKYFKSIPYEEKLKIMGSEKFDFPVTRSMTTRQMTEYLKEVWDFFRGQGFILTDPEE